ncbi:iron-sulfur cluster assembly protein [Allosalinactinospora lopnorensis]|uniref:iron-sulfur cluster assembly protein n=1 Tax=Allosalinactinospora lopnorensis TaxID=1352348 RepID=UPI000623FEAD|nr:iron-sulfur cluster assembly protein [Allosalinactinospora lopnorensis]
MSSAVEDTLTVRVWEALDTVVDPELDQPITELGFVEGLDVTADSAGGRRVRLRLRLPTYFCAPNFAYLMVADAHDAASAVRGVSSVRVELEDHFAADEINAGVAAEAGFGGSFPEQATGELSDLRAAFRRKAHLACLERACRRLIDDGWEIDALADGRIGDLPASQERDSLLRRRSELGLRTELDAPLFVEDSGDRVPSDQVAKRLRFAKAVRVSIDGNAGVCRGLLQTRYQRIAQEGEG